MIIYEALEIKKDATGTGLWRMVKSSDEAKERTYFPLCDCANGHSTPDEARDCAAEQHPQDAFLNPPNGNIGDKWCCIECAKDKRIAELEDEKYRRGNLLEDVVNEVAMFGYPDMTVNAAGAAVSTEPEPAQLVAHAIRVLKARAEKAEAARDAAIREIGVIARKQGLAEADRDRLRDALKLLVADVADYEAWERPCYALDQAKAALDATGGE